MPEYDAHVAFVANHRPAPPEEWSGPAPVYLEVVVFEAAGILPRFVLSLDAPYISQVCSVQ